MARVLTSIFLREPDFSAISPAPPAEASVDALQNVLDIVTVRMEFGFGRGSLRTALVSPVHPAAEYLTAGRVLELTYTLDHTDPEEEVTERWRITRAEADEAGGGAAGGGFRITARPIELDLQESIAKRTYSDGTVTPYVSVYNMAVSDALDFILEDLGDPGGPTTAKDSFPPGDVDASLASVAVTFAAEGATHFDLLRLLVENVGAETGNEGALLSFRPVGGVVYVDVLAAPFEDAAVATLGHGEVFALRRTEDYGERPTRLFPLAGPEGAGVTIADLVWTVAGYNSPSDTVDVRTPAGANGLSAGIDIGPVWKSDALIGAFIGNDDEGFAEITDSTYPSSLVTDGSRPFVIGEKVRLAEDALGAPLTSLEVVGTPAGAAVRERLRRYADVGPAPNLIEQAGHDATFETVSDFTLLGTAADAAVTASASPQLVRFGEGSRRITASAVGDGIETELYDLDIGDTKSGDLPQRLPPYASAWLGAHYESGKWYVEIVDSLGVSFPGDDVGRFDAEEDEAIALAGFEPSNVGKETNGRYQVKLRITCVDLGEGGAASIVLDAATLTQSALEYPYRPGLGPFEAWQRAARELRKLSLDPLAEYAGEVIDPGVLSDPTLADIAVGDNVRVLLPESLGRPYETDVTVPVVAVEADYGGPTATTNVGRIKRLSLGQREPDGSSIGAALGLEPRPGSELNAPGSPALSLNTVRVDGVPPELEISVDSLAPRIGRATILDTTTSITVDPETTFNETGIQVTAVGVAQEHFGITNIQPFTDPPTFDIEMAAAATADRDFNWVVFPSLPGVDVNLSAVAGEESVTLTWDKMGGEDGVIVYWDTNSGTPYANSLQVDDGDLTDNGNGTWSYTVTGLTGGTLYYFVVEPYIET